jgi:hypothetical protein
MCWSESDSSEGAARGPRSGARLAPAPDHRLSRRRGAHPGTLAITDALDAIDALALPIGPLTSDAVLARALEVWSIVQPQMLIATLDTFSFLSPRTDAPALSYVLLLTPSDASALTAPPRDNVYRVLSVPMLGTFIAGECSAHDGLHVAEDAFLAEVVAGDGTALPHGQVGQLILSTLQRSHAVLRFDSGLRAALDRTPCSYGETHARLRLA